MQENHEDKALKNRGRRGWRGLPVCVSLIDGRYYQARGHANGREVYLGLFRTAEEAGAVAQEFKNKRRRERDLRRMAA